MQTSEPSVESLGSVPSPNLDAGEVGELKQRHTLLSATPSASPHGLDHSTPACSHQTLTPRRSIVLEVPHVPQLDALLIVGMSVLCTTE